MIRMNPIYFFGAVLIVAGLSVIAVARRFEKPAPTKETVYFVSYSANVEDGRTANGMERVTVTNDDRSFETLVGMSEIIRKKHNFKPNSVVITNLLKP